MDQDQTKAPRSLSLRWRLSLALIGLPMGFVLMFVAVAKETFESDKIAYVYETRQSQLEALSTNLLRKLERGLTDANSVFIGFDTDTKQLSPLAQKVFDSQTSLLAIELTRPGDEKPIAQISKTPTLKERLSQSPALPEGSSFFATALDQSKFLVMAKDKSSGGDLIRAIVEIPDAMASKDARGTLMLIEDGKIISATKTFNLDQDVLEELSQDRLEGTLMRRLANENYLLSISKVSGTNLKLVSLDSEASALSAVEILYNRAVIFIGFSVFLSALISLVLSTGLTRKLQSLTEIAGEIGKGDFSQQPMVTSGDEVGVLQRAFQRMSSEIQKLLLETKEKVRMEEELKTTRLVQDSLFPKEATFEVDGFRLSGSYETSTECGGDWWYYFKRGDDLVVAIADATGHGTPSALVTAAARSLFSSVEEEDMPLPKIAKAWDKATAASTGQKVFMTALIVKLNTKTGRGFLLNASHEAPLLITPNGESDYIALPNSGTLGELREKWEESPFEMKPGERLFLFTDGLWAVESPEQKTFSENRFAKRLAKLSQDHKSPESFLATINQIIQDHRLGTAYPDDVTLVVIDRLS